MKIFITGGTGFVGRTLTARLNLEGHEVTVLARSARADGNQSEGVYYLEGNPTLEGEWQTRVPEHDVIINLAGASIFTRWTPAAKEAIRNSRILTTRNLVNALSRRQKKETRLLSTSAVGYYDSHGDEPLTEECPAGSGFLSSVTREWEAEALRAGDFGIKVLLLRFGVILGKEGGALKPMVRAFRWYVGSPLGSGEQWFSWIHEQDLADLYVFLIQEKSLGGPVNCTAPNPVRNKDLTMALAEALGRPVFLPAVPGFMIKTVMGEFGSLLLEGQKVIPKALLDRGFGFRFPDIRGALKDLVA